MGLDQVVLHVIVDHRTAWVTAFSRTVADVGMDPVTYPVTLALCALFGWRFRAWRPAASAPVAAVVAVVATEFVKAAIGRPRPPHDLALLTTGGSSMPSSIAAMTAAAALPVAVVGVRVAGRAGLALVVLMTAATLGVGACMVYLGAHWLTDVVAGWVLGSAVGAAVFRVIAGPFRGRRERVDAQVGRSAAGR